MKLSKLACLSLQCKDQLGHVGEWEDSMDRESSRADPCELVKDINRAGELKALTQNLFIDIFTKQDIILKCVVVPKTSAK